MSEVEPSGEVRVLVVDDDADSREVTAAFLRSSGFDVEEFENAEDALAQAPRADVIVTDITLPGMSGYELARRLRTQSRDKRLVLFALSGRSDASPEQARLFDRVVVKPFDPDALVDALQASTGRAPASAQRAAAGGADHGTLGTGAYRALVERSPALLWRAGRDGRCDYLNATWLAFIGRSGVEDFDAARREAIHPDDANRYRDAFARAFEARGPFELRYRLRRHDGVYRTVLDRAVPYQDDAEKFAGFVGSAVDVDEAAQRDRARTTFMSMLAHEMRTPLTPLRAYQVQIQRLQAKGEPVSAEVVERLGRQVDRLAAFVENLGDAARLDTQRPLMFSPEPCDFAAIVAGVVAKHQAQLAQRRDSARTPKLHFTSAGHACPVVADPKRLAQVVATLIGNALKFSPDGGTVTVLLSTEGDQHRLVVADEGIGIPEGELRLVGTPYFRASNAPSDVYPGLGLGLAVAKEVVTAHRGTLELANRSRGLAASVTLAAASQR